MPFKNIKKNYSEDEEIYSDNISDTEINDDDPDVKEYYEFLKNKNNNSNVIPETKNNYKPAKANKRNYKKVSDNEKERRLRTLEKAREVKKLKNIKKEKIDVEHQLSKDEIKPQENKAPIKLSKYEQLYINKNNLTNFSEAIKNFKINK